MSTQITEAFVQQYSSNIYMLAQQKGSKLRPFVRQESQKGKTEFFDRIGSVSPKKKTSRHGDSPIMDTPHSRRGVTLTDYEWGDMIDKEDKIRTLIDPENAYIQAAMYSLGRAMDDELIAAALGSAYSGEKGDTAVALGSGQRIQSIASSAAANLNVDALLNAKYLMDAADIDPDLPRYIAVNASALKALLGATQVTSSDYNNVKALVEGKVDTFLGFKFIHLERLVAPSVAFKFSTSTGLYDGSGTSVTLSGSKSCIAWAGDGLLLSVGADMQAEVAKRADKSFNWYAYASMSVGAVRMEEAKVVEIICKQ